MRFLKLCFSVWLTRISNTGQGGRTTAGTAILLTVMPKSVRNHIHSQGCMLAKDELLLMMIKQEASVTNYCKQVSQSLIPSGLSPGAVMGNKMEKHSKLLNSFGEKWSNQLPGDASSKQDPSWSRAAPLLCSAQTQWPKSSWTSPTTAWLCPDVSAVPIPFTFYPGPLQRYWAWTHWLSPLL